MSAALANRSRIAKQKTKFVVYRLLTYFGFLLVPVWSQKSLELNFIGQTIFLLCYMLFMAGQWYLLGKEIDHRFKIYYRVNSSMDRILYRSLMGHVSFILYFGLLSLIPDFLLKHFFWGTWVVLGIFYSWPTRGKIIQETMTSQFGEFHFLDRFEKTVLGMILIFFLVSIPEHPQLQNLEALKLFFDPNESFHPQVWNFLKINYFPFKKFPDLFRLSWLLHIYFVGGGLILLLLYALSRVFFSRRLSILCLFAFISSWSYSKFLVYDYASPIVASFGLLWVWALLWITKSSTYRSGLFLGLVHYFGTLFNPLNIFLLPISVGLLLFNFLNERTKWYKKQLLKYVTLGAVLCAIVLTSKFDTLMRVNLDFNNFYKEIAELFDRKGFLSLSLIGLVMSIAMLNESVRSRLRYLAFEREKYVQLLLSVLVVFLTAFLFNKNLAMNYNLMAFLCFFCMVPIEWIFQSITRFRSKRNLIFGAYVLICLLDSHFEGRVKILMSLINSN